MCVSVVAVCVTLTDISDLLYWYFMLEYIICALSFNTYFYMFSVPVSHTVFLW